MTIERFRDRAHAGTALGSALGSYAGRDDVLVLGLPRGGVPVAREVARALHAPLDIALARKLGVPGIAEVALGAVAEGTRGVVLDPVQRYIGVPRQVVRRIAERERAEVQRRALLYRGGRVMVEVRGRTVILVDDGLATGATTRAAARAIKKRRPARLVVAVPVAAARSAAYLRPEANDVIALITTESLGTVSDWYDDFSPVSDGDVRQLLGAPSAAPIVPAVPEARDEQEVAIPADGCTLAGDLGLPVDLPTEISGLVILAHGGGSSRHSYRNRYLAGRLRLAGFATLRVDLLTEMEATTDADSGRMRFDVPCIAQRLIAACDWAARNRVPGAKRIVLFGASTGAGAALVAAAARPTLVSAVVSRGGRVDLAGEVLTSVTQPVLLVVGGADIATLRWNREAMYALSHAARLHVVPRAGHMFEEVGALGEVGEQVVRWLDRTQKGRLLALIASTGHRLRLLRVGQRVLE